jgi:hypothetical protein
MIPMWVYFVVAGIILSAYMAVRTGREEKKIENEIIEREGEVYMKRLEEKRGEKNEAEKSLGV